jgi:hypothetical protein
MKIYERWLIARGNVFAPSAGAVVKLVQVLRDGGFLPPSGGFALSSAEGGDAPRSEALPGELTAEWLDAEARADVRLVWPVRAGVVHAPLTALADGGADGGTEGGADGGAVDFTLEVHRASDFVIPTADSIGALPCTCACGEDLAYEWDPEEVVSPFGEATGIFTECEECSRTFDPAKGMAELRNPLGGASEEVPGGAAYRFALAVTTPHIPTDARVTFAPALVALLEKQFGRSFYEVAAVRDGERP